jgi:hypothetical protein
MTFHPIGLLWVGWVHSVHITIKAFGCVSSIALGHVIKSITSLALWKNLSSSSKTLQKQKKFLWKVGKLFLFFLNVLTSSWILLYKKQPSFRHGKALGGWHYENHQGHTWLCLVQAPYSGNSLPLGPYQPCNYPYDLPFPSTMRLVAQKVDHSTLQKPSLEFWSLHQ